MKHEQPQNIELLKGCVIAVIGKRGSGKTTTTREYINSYLNAYKPNGKIFILDTDIHPAYEQVPEIDKNKIPSLTRGVVKVIDNSHADTVEIFNRREFTSAMVICEDSYKYFPGNQLSNELNKLVIASKQKRVWIIFMYHAWKFIPRDLCRLVDFYIIHKTSDGPESKRDDIGEFEDVYTAYVEVKNSGNRFEKREVRGN